MLNFVPKFSNVILHPLFQLTLLMVHTASCKTTPNISPALLKTSLNQIVSTGGRLLESPDLNPIENPWHEVKEHLRVKPNKVELD